MFLQTLALVNDVVVTGVFDLNCILLVDYLLLTLDTPPSGLPYADISVEFELRGDSEGFQPVFIGADGERVLVVDTAAGFEAEVLTTLGTGEH